MKILRRNVSKDEFKKFLENIDLNDKSLYEELTENQNFIFQFGANTASRMTKQVKPENFDDVVAINCLSRPGCSFCLNDYDLIKNENQKPKYPPQILQFLEDTRGCILTQEAVMRIGEYITNGKFIGDTWRRLLKKLGKAKKDPKDLQKWSEMIACAKEEGAKLGISTKDVDMICDDLLTLSAYSFNKSHASAYSYLAMETVYLAKYFKPYFYAINLANEAGKVDTIKDAIQSCKNSGFEVVQPDINNSKEHFFPKENNLFFGLQDITGVGEEPAKIIVSNQPYTSIIDFICKTIDTKVNKRITSALIGGGAFDNLIGSENRKYYFDVAQKFYEKKKTKKNPELLKELWEECEKEIEKKVDKQFLMESEITYLGGSFFNNRFSVISDKIETLYKRGWCLRDFEEIRKKNLPKQYCFVYVNKYRQHTDKNGNEMMFFEIEDRNGEKQSVPVFASYWKYCKTKFNDEGFYLMDVYPTEDGKIMFGSRNWVRDPKTIMNMMARVPGV